MERKESNKGSKKDVLPEQIDETGQRWRDGDRPIKGRTYG